MKLFLILLLVLSVTAASAVTVNTLAAQKTIAANPLAKLGMPNYTWSDVGKAAQTIKPVQIPANQIGGWMSSSWQSAQTQLSGLGQQTQVTTQHLQTIAGTKQLIGVASNPAATPHPSISPTPTLANQPNPGPTEAFYSKALEYGRYVYCQEVITNYEKQHPEVKPTGR